MINLVEGWTGNIDYQLKADGIAVNLNGLTVSIVARKQDGAAITLTGTLTITDEPTGKVRFAPGATDILAASSPCQVRFKVTDGFSKVTYFPSGGAEQWNIRK